VEFITKNEKEKSYRELEKCLVHLFDEGNKEKNNKILPLDSL